MHSIPKGTTTSTLTLFNLLQQHLRFAPTTAIVLTPLLESPTSDVVSRPVLVMRNRFETEYCLCFSIHRIYSRPKIRIVINAPIYFTMSDSYNLECMLFQVSQRKTQRFGYRAGFQVKWMLPTHISCNIVENIALKGFRPKRIRSALKWIVECPGGEHFEVIPSQPGKSSPLCQQTPTEPRRAPPKKTISRSKNDLMTRSGPHEYRAALYTASERR